MHVSTRRQPVRKGCTRTSFQLCGVLEKADLWRRCEQRSPGVYREGGVARWSPQDFSRSESTLHGTVTVASCHYTRVKPTECMTLREPRRKLQTSVNKNVSTWVIRPNWCPPTDTRCS